jgi:phosphate transport system permease protein
MLTRSRSWDGLLHAALRAASLVVLAMIVTLVVVVGRAAWPSVERFGVDFVSGTEWRPNEIERPKRDANNRVVIEDGEAVTETIAPSFGALPVVVGTLQSALLAMLLAFPVGVLTALVLVRDRRWGKLSFGVEMLAAVPSVTFGMWGLFVLAPTLGRNLLAGSLVLATMVVPIVTSFARDVLRAVPSPIVEGAVALGARWHQVSWIMVKESRRGLLGAGLLGFARAAGETMAVTMVIGNANRIATSLTDPTQTMASLLANEFAEASTELHRAALLEVALLLLVLSLAIHIVARRLVVRVGATG